MTIYKRKLKISRLGRKTCINVPKIKFLLYKSSTPKKRKEMSAQESVGRVNGNQQLLSTRFRVKLQPFMPFI